MTEAMTEKYKEKLQAVAENSPMVSAFENLFLMYAAFCSQACLTR